MAAPELEDAQVDLGAPDDELAQVAAVADPGRTRVAGQEPGQGQADLVEQRRAGRHDRGGGHGWTSLAGVLPSRSRPAATYSPTWSPACPARSTQLGRLRP